jgi:hypothetical protein
MGDGYALIGSGFGLDKTKIQVFEGRFALPPSALVSNTNERIIVRSKPSGIIQHSVVVSGRASNALMWTHFTVSSLPSSKTTYIESQEGKLIQPYQFKNPVVSQITGAPQIKSAASKTIAVSTGALQMTGPGVGVVPVKLTTGALQMIGPGGGVASVKLTTGMLQMTGPGVGVAPVKLTTVALQMTGSGIEVAALKLTTGALQMTGPGVGTASLKLTTKALQMTGPGIGVAPVRLSTAELRMTGLGL